MTSAAPSLRWKHRGELWLARWLRRWFRLGPLEETSPVHVWTFFPVSAAEPDIELP